MARSLGVSEGEIIYLDITAKDIFGPLWDSYIGETQSLSENITTIYTKKLYVPVKVSRIFSSANGKFDNDISTAILMEYATVVPYILQFASPFISEQKIANLSTIDLYHFAQFVMVNLPPPRIDAYLSR